MQVSDPMASLAYYTGSLGFELVENQDETFIWLKKDGVEFLLRKGNATLTGENFGLRIGRPSNQ